MPISPSRGIGNNQWHSLEQPTHDIRSSTSEPAQATTKSGVLGFLRMSWNIIGTFFKAIWRSAFPQSDPKMKLLVNGDARGKPMADVSNRQFKAIGVVLTDKNRIATEINAPQVNEAGARRLLTRGCVKTVTSTEAKAIQIDACLTGLNISQAQSRGWKPVQKYGDYCNSETVTNNLAESLAKLANDDNDLKCNLQGKLSQKQQERIIKMMESVKESALKTEDSAKKYASTLQQRLNPEAGQLKQEKVDEAVYKFLVPQGIHCISRGVISDPRSGLAGNISFNPETREIVVGFSGAGSFSDCKKCFDAMAGYIPENFAKADELIHQLKERLQTVNSHLSSEEKFSLRVVGHSMGGGIAAYVGAKHEIPFTTFNGLKLGSGLIQAIGEEKIAAAAHLGKRYVSEGDWVGDTHGGQGFTSWAFKGVDSGRYLGEGYLIPKEYDRDVQLRKQNADTHNSPVKILEALSENQQYEEAPVLPECHDHGFRSFLP